MSPGQKRTRKRAPRRGALETKAGCPRYDVRPKVVGPKISLVAELHVQHTDLSSSAREKAVAEWEVGDNLPADRVRVERSEVTVGDTQRWRSRFSGIGGCQGCEEAGARLPVEAIQ